jgi:siroheme synthase-like protein
MTETYPLFLRLRGRRVLVVGAGKVATTKLAALRDAGAELTVVAPEVSPAILALAEAGEVTLHVRPVEGHDLDAAWLVIAAAPPAINRVVHAWGEARKTFVLAVDDVASTDAFSPAVFTRGDVRIALSSEGRAPALVGLLREALEHALPDDDELAAWLQIAVAQRAAWKRDGVPHAERRSQLLRLLAEQRAVREPIDAGGRGAGTERP